MNRVFKIIFIQAAITCLFICSEGYAASCGGGTGPNGTPLPSLAKPMTISVPPNVAPPIVAKVVWIKGTVKVIGANKKERIVKANSPIYLNDTIVTGSGSQAQIIYSDYTQMTFQQNTKLFVNKYEYHPEVKTGSQGKYLMNLIEGGYRTITGSIAKHNPDDYEVDTDVAIMGVRGTDYAAAYGSCKLYMKFNSGTPIVHNRKGTIVLTSQSPYAYVPSVNVAPVSVKQQPVAFQVPLPIQPATFNLKTIIKEDAPKIPTSGGGSGAGCAPTGWRVQ